MLRYAKADPPVFEGLFWRSIPSYSRRGSHSALIPLFTVVLCCFPLNAFSVCSHRNVWARGLFSFREEKRGEKEKKTKKITVPAAYLLYFAVIVVLSGSPSVLRPVRFGCHSFLPLTANPSFPIHPPLPLFVILCSVVASYHIVCHFT